MNHQPLRARPQVDHEHVSQISTGTILFIISAAVLAVYELQLVLIPFVLAAVVSYVCAPAIAFASARTGLPRPIVSVIAFLILLGLGGLIGLLGIPPFLGELTRVATDLHGTLARLAETAIGGRTINLFGQHMDAQQLADSMSQEIVRLFGNARALSLVAEAGVMSGFGFLLTLVLLFFFMLNGPAIIRGLLWLVPPGQRPLIEDHILLQIDPELRRYFVGVIGVICFASVFSYFGLGFVLGIPHALFLALVTGILEAIPIVGPVTAAVIAGMVALQHNAGLGAVIGFAAYLAALRLSIDQLVGPVVLGVAGRVHPALIIFCFLAGGALFGVVGIIIAVPVALVVRTTLSVLYDEPPGGLPRNKKQRGAQ